MLQAGKRISHYELIQLLGKGGMGEVWLAHDTGLDRQVAIKFLAESIQTEPNARMRFLREAKAAASLDHPFICKIYETGEAEGQTFIAMEYVEGSSLRDKLEGTKVSAREALQITLEVAQALEVAHAKGIVHRDLKPANIMCTPQGHAKVMDFGIAKKILPGGETGLAGIAATLTQVAVTERGVIVGTIGYMSPEQAKGENVDGRSDIFALGIVLYEMLSGKHPFAKPTPVETLSAVLKDQVPAFSVTPKNINPAVHHVLKKCLAKEPDQRYQRISEFAAEVQKVREEMVVGLPTFLRGWRAVAAGAIVLALAGLAVWRLALKPKGPSVQAAVAPVSVLVVDFQNRANDPMFSGAVEQSIVLGLEEASFINIYKREDARRKAGQLDPNAGGKLDSRLGQLVCRSEGVQYLIDGSIEQSEAGTFVLKVLLIDPVMSKTVLDIPRTVDKKIDVINAAAKVSVPISEKLGGRLSEAAQRTAVETFTTSSLEAMNAYAKAQELIKQGKRPEAMQEYERAIKEDPNFGRAYSGLAVAYHNSGELSNAESYHQMALARIDSMNDREKYRTRGIWYLMTKNSKKAIEEFSRLVKLFPADSAGHSNLAFAYFLDRDMSRAVEEGLYYTKIYPVNINGQYNLAWYAIAAGNFTMALDQVKRTLELNPKFEKIHVCAAVAELAQGRNAEAEAWYKKLEPISATGAAFAAHGLADLALYEGRQSEAVKILEQGIEADTQNKKTDMAAEKFIALGQARLLQGQKSAALEAADRAVSMLREANILFPAAEIYLWAGKEDKAIALAKELGGRVDPEPQAYAKIILGRIALKKGQVNEAINAYMEAQKFVDTWLGRLSLAEAYLEAKAFTQAHSELDVCMKRRGEAASIFLNDIPSFRYFPQVYYYLGRTQEGLKSPQARESYQTFLIIKAKDEGDPMVKDARRRLGAL
jgi:tetratricopeptide (TPR) repeat protein/predicted Ser/Thr protein kinase